MTRLTFQLVGLFNALCTGKRSQRLQAGRTRPSFCEEILQLCLEPDGEPKAIQVGLGQGSKLTDCMDVILSKLLFQGAEVLAHHPPELVDQSSCILRDFGLGGFALFVCCVHNSP